MQTFGIGVSVIAEMKYMVMDLGNVGNFCWGDLCVCWGGVHVCAYMYDTLSQADFTLWTADMILLRTRKLYLIHEFHCPFHRKMYICLLVQCHLCSIWPPVLPLKLNLYFKFPPLLPWANLLYTHASDISCTKSHVHFLSLRSFIQGIHPGPRSLLYVHSKLIFSVSC
jgi:hypothetical protein